MSKQRNAILLCLLLGLVILAAGAWVLVSRIESPAEAAAKAAPPTPSLITEPVQLRELKSTIITRGTGRYGLPISVSLSASLLKGATPGLITTLPMPHTEVQEGGTLLQASGRPLLVLQGAIPAYRDLVPGTSGDDVKQLEEALARLNFDPGPVDGEFDRQTSAAVEAWYRSLGWEPFGPTLEQQARLETLEKERAAARKSKLAADAAVAAATLDVKSSEARAEHTDQVATVDVEAKKSRRDELQSRESLALEAALATAEYDSKLAAAEIATKINDRALVVLDPRQTTTARRAANTQLEVARANANAAKLRYELAVQTSERDVKLAEEQLKLSQAAAKAIELEGEGKVWATATALQLAEFDAQLAAEQVDRAAAKVELAKSKLGIQIPVDEIVFFPSLPVRVQDLTAAVGDRASGAVMTVTDFQMSVDVFLALEHVPYVEEGTPVQIDDDLGIRAEGVVKMVAQETGTRGADGYHHYTEIEVTGEAPATLNGKSVRLTIPYETTEGAVIAVPIGALMQTADGKSRVQVVGASGKLQDVEVKEGLAAAGWVEVNPVGGTLEPGQRVVVGYERPDEQLFSDSGF